MFDAGTRLISRDLASNKAKAGLERSRRLAGEAGWVAIGQVLTGLAGLVSVRLLTEVLTPASYGVLALLLGFTTLAFNFGAWPFIQASMRFRAEFRLPSASALLRRESTRFLKWGLLVVTVVLLVAGVVFGPMADMSIWIGAVLVCVVLADTTRTYETSLLNSARRQKTMVLWRVTDAWMRPLFAVAMVLAFDSGESAVLFGYAIATMTVSLLFARWITLEGKAAPPTNITVPSAEPLSDGVSDLRLHELNGSARASSDTAHIRDRIRSFFLPLLPIAALTWVTAVSDRYLLAGMLDLKSAGLYAAVYAVVSRPYLMVGAFLDVCLRPRLYDAAANGQWKALGRLAVFWAALASGIGVLGLFCFVMLHHFVANLILAAPYRGNTEIMPWIAGGYVLATVAQVFQRLCYAFNRTELVLYGRIVAAISMIAVTIPAIASFGLFGAALAVPIYFGVQLVFSMGIAAVAIRDAMAATESGGAGL